VLMVGICAAWLIAMSMKDRMARRAVAFKAQ
jgi:hypothetical protein